MKFIDTTLPGVVLVEPEIFRDQRGYFFEVYHQSKFATAGIPQTFVQDNQSRSLKGTLRGLHAQRRRPQGKLVRALSGTIFDVAVDIRADSPELARWVGVELSDENFRSLWVPPGFAHGFLVMSDEAVVEYKCTDLYDRGDEIGVAWNDSRIGIEWPLEQAPLLSPKDEAWPSLDHLLAEMAAAEGAP